ncbi:unnamed protein product [Lymnaea stagnalis]|uniref:Uracil-DNA glycosylase n=1 Tax=Lymnaea stagnalis TaxID=6523 RepID=A0AAV2I837_LYMST
MKLSSFTRFPHFLWSFNMSQTKISAFFQSPMPTAIKRDQQKMDRKRSTVPADSDQNTLSKSQVSSEPELKKAKLFSSDLGDRNSHGTTGLVNEASEEEVSAQEKKKVENNKITAKIKLTGNKTSGLVVNIGLSWFHALDAEFSKEYFLKLSQFIAQERKCATVYPPADRVFTWTKGCDINSVKVVIIGQDPYHGPKQAHGLCFSVLPGIKAPPSLENIFKELENSIDGFKRPKHGNLIGWAQQGVLLLNACLTVKAGQANSHAGRGWETFTDAVINWLNSNLTGVVFMLWGAYAQKKGSCINKKKHHMLTAVHPSPLSAHRGFLGCKHFSTCNELLIKDGRKPIDWTHLPEKEEL